jgi:tetratricopeptide (TPR) repeat protein
VDEAYQALPAIDDPMVRARLLINFASHRPHLLPEAIAAAEATGSQAILASCRVMQAGFAHGPEGIELLDQARELAAGAGVVRTEAVALANGANRRSRAGQHAEALRRQRQALSGLERIGAGRFAEHARVMTGQYETALGLFEVAHEHLSTAARRLEQIGDVRWWGYARIYLAELLVHLDEPARAAQLAREVGNDDPVMAARVLLACGDRAGAATALGDSDDVYVAAVIHRLYGRLDEARAVLDGAETEDVLNDIERAWLAVRQGEPATLPEPDPLWAPHCLPRLAHNELRARLRPADSAAMLEAP